MGITKDVKVDYGYDDTGATSNTVKWNTLTRPDMAGQDTCVLNFTGSGTYKFTGSASGIANYGDVTFNLGTATLSDGGTGGSGGSSDGPAGLFSSGHEGQIGIDATVQIRPGFSTPGGKSARILTCNAGATSVTLTPASVSAGHISRFAVNQWIMVAGWAIQGQFYTGYSFPNNFHWHDYVKITSIVGSTIFFSGHSLANYYDQNWPELNRGTEFEIEAAGPATIFVMSSDWDGTTTVNSGTVDVTPASGSDTFINNCRRVFAVNNCTQPGKTFYPSMNQFFTATNCSAPNILVEHDKNIDTATVSGGTYRNWKVQSSSTKLLTIDGTTITSQIQGTGRAAQISNCTINGNLIIGPLTYGRGETISVTNTSISGTISDNLGGAIPGRLNAVSFNWPTIATSMVNGLITIPMSVGADILGYLMPDSRGRHILWWSSSLGTFAPFKVLSATADTWPPANLQTVTMNVTTVSSGSTLQTPAGNFSAADIGKVIIIPGASGTNVTSITGWSTSAGTDTLTLAHTNSTTQTASSQSVLWGTCNAYIQTDQPAGFPASSLYSSGSGTLSVRVPRVRSAYFSNVTGSDTAIDLSQAAAQNRPLSSYTKRTYDGQTGFTTINGPTVPMYGQIVSFKINVLTPYTGAGTLAVQFNMGLMQGDIQTGTNVSYGGFFDLKVPGERAMLPNGVTTGLKPNDGGTINLAATNWVRSGMQVVTSRDITAESAATKPSFTIEMITDQGFPAEVPAAVVPLMLRLRAA